MEDTIEVGAVIGYERQTSVLILVLMEDTLEA